MATAAPAAPRASASPSRLLKTVARSRAPRAFASTPAAFFRKLDKECFGKPPRRGLRVSAGAGEEAARYDAQAKEDDARQYGVWGVDGIRQRSASFAQMEEDWEHDVARVWRAHGAGQVAAQRLLILGASWQKGALAELYRDAEAVAHAIEGLVELLPGANAPAIFHATPDLALVCLDRRELSKRLVSLRRATGRVPPFDVAVAVSKAPSVLLRDSESIRETCAAAVDAAVWKTGWLLDAQGVASLLETSPSMLTGHPDDVAASLEGFDREMREKVRGVPGWNGAPLASRVLRDDARVPDARLGVGGETVSVDGTGTGTGSGERNQTWRSCWNAMGEDARATATRASVDYAGRVAEPYLRRARIERERKSSSTR
jgi:hypothetical protein